MELHQLRAFGTVAREGNLSRAARILCASQPAVSAQVKALEDELGLPLFQRLPRGMRLTPSGEALLPRSDAVLEAVASLSALAGNLRGEPVGTLRLGALSDPELLRLAAILARLQERHPGLSVELRHATSGVLREELLAGHLDAAFVLGPSEPALERRTLLPMGLSVVLPAEADPALPWEAIRRLRWIGTPAGCPLQILSRELFDREGSVPGSVFEVEIERTIVEMVAAGMGAGLLREDTARWAAARGKCRIWSGPGLATTVALVWRSGRGEDPGIRALRRAVDSSWQAA